MGGLNTHTHTQDNYRNPRCACAPRVNYVEHYGIHQRRIYTYIYIYIIIIIIIIHTNKGAEMKRSI